MKYGDQFTVGRTLPRKVIYRYTEWGEYSTNRLGNGLWKGDRQIAGTCDFTVAGCQTEKAAKAKIRRYVNGL